MSYLLASCLLDTFSILHYTCAYHVHRWYLCISSQNSYGLSVIFGKDLGQIEHLIFQDLSACNFSFNFTMQTFLLSFHSQIDNSYPENKVLSILPQMLNLCIGLCNAIPILDAASVFTSKQIQQCFTLNRMMQFTSVHSIL